MSSSESRPNRNAIRKVYISRSIERGLQRGDLIVFYRTADSGPAHYRSVTTTIGVVQNTVLNIKNLDEFLDLCRKRSVFTNEELTEQWNYNPRYRPFIVEFLYVYSFPKRLTLKELKELNIISEAPRGFELMSDQSFTQLLEHSNADKRLIVN